MVLEQLDRVHERIASRFPRARAREYMSGLVPGLERKNGWTLAEQAGEVSPDGMQRLLRWADWDIDGGPRRRAGLRDRASRRAGWRADCGRHRVPEERRPVGGVQRQHSGTAGRIENCQIGTFLAYAMPRGHALIDRELYLPGLWIADRERCLPAGIPDGTEFQTKPRQAMSMLARAFEAAVPSRRSPPMRRTGKSSTCGRGWMTATLPMCWPPRSTTP